jgi:hypothetical protein
MKNTSSSKKIKIINGEIEQVIDPVFRTPSFLENGFRSHFYASIKKIPFTHQYITTFWANLLVIWSMSLIAFIALYYEWLKRVIEKASGIKLPKIKLPFVDKLLVSIKNAVAKLKTIKLKKVKQTEKVAEVVDSASVKTEN